MEKHDVQIVEVHEHNTFKGKNVEYVATYEYCELTEEYLATEEMITENDIVYISEKNNRQISNTGYKGEASYGIPE